MKNAWGHEAWSGSSTVSRESLCLTVGSGAWLPGRRWRGGGAAHCGIALRGGHSSDQQLRQQDSGHVLPELSEMYTVSFCLLKGGAGRMLSGVCVTRSVLPEG